MSAGHTHALPKGQNQKYLLIAFLLTSTFLIAEVIGGFITGSLALFVRRRTYVDRCKRASYCIGRHSDR